jgi:tetratricopeptide (TPR) repeat protein
MTQAISNKNHWQEILTEQKLANARRWLSLVESHNDPTTLVSTDYDNFLRAIETTLQSLNTFDLAYKLIQSIYIFALDYADWDRWLIYLENALKFSQELNYKIEQANLLVQIGDILYRTANLQQAEDSYSKASKIFDNSNSRADYASTLAKLAVLYDLQGKNLQAISLCEEAQTIAESLNDKRVATQLNLYLSRIYHRSREWELALATAQKAYNFYKENGPPKFARKALMNIIAIWAELGEWGKIEQVTEDLVNTLGNSGDVRTLSQLKNNLGFAAYNQENYKLAEAAWQEALRLHSQIQEPAELANLYNNLGMVYTRLAEWEIAEEMLNQAIDAHEQLGDVYNWANSLDNLADLYEVQGETAVCRQVLIEAQTGLQTLADSPHAQELLNSIAKRLASLPPD